MKARWILEILAVTSTVGVVGCKHTIVAPEGTMVITGTPPFVIIVTNASAPIFTNIAAPVLSNFPAPIRTNVPAQSLTNFPAPVLTNIPAAIRTNVAAPIFTNVSASVATNISAPVLTNYPAPILTNYPAPVLTNVGAPILTNVVQGLTEVASLLKAKPGLITWNKFWFPLLVMICFGALGGWVKWLLDYARIRRLGYASPSRLDRFLESTWRSGNPRYDIIVALATGCFVALLVPGILLLFDAYLRGTKRDPLEILQKASSDGFILMGVASLCSIAGLIGQPVINGLRKLPKLLRLPFIGKGKGVDHE